MKKMKNSWIGFVLALILIPFTQSCSDLDSDYSSYPWIDAEGYSIATIHSIENDDKYYFLLDGGQKLYPSDISRISSTYKWEVGQRAIIFFNLFEEEITGYDYNAELIFISNVLTKDIIPLTEATADSIGDDKINLTRAWFGGNYLNFEFQFQGTRNPKELHMVNLVRNETSKAVEDDNYIVLELRHNAYDDYPQEILNGIVSFKLALTNEELEKYKGIKVRTNSIYNGIQYDICSFDKLNINQMSGTQTNMSEVQ
ncbi:NigD-like protein [Bacteroides sp. 519]|uniref:NigD-like protein n=1 Tax=Bacteroides sp. 519 TaxID=2302937 RepID=UPI0013D33D25|nr:NigD-like protein [Bacteroides sp. 519]NDV59605.1 hypothetical protein [Bacteroides sp. 519]